MLTAGALTDPQLPATALNMCTTDARLGGVGRVPPPIKNPGYASAIFASSKLSSFLCCSSVLTPITLHTILFSSHLHWPCFAAVKQGRSNQLLNSLWTFAGGVRS